jgi:RimJ/RimL family protein N-acetyltransferase
MRTDIVPDEIVLRIGAPAPSATLAAGMDGFQIRPLDVVRDAATLHRWFVEERAAFWNMQDRSVDEVAAYYRAVEDSGHARAWIGTEHGASAFLFESYDPAYDEVGDHYRVRPGDLGMHLFVGPAAKHVRGHTRRVFQALMRFLFDELHAQRIVVEPDARNTRIHALNRAMGFTYERDVTFREKTASLAFCTRADFYATLHKTNTKEQQP